MSGIFLGLGSNQGDRHSMLTAARRELAAGGITIVAASSVLETKPFGYHEQPDFLNQVLEVAWAGSARDLLELAKAVEASLGRKPGLRWGPRAIDVDILLFGDELIDEHGLVVPHPGLRQRRFVLESLAEIAPDLRYPGSKESLASLLTHILD